MGKLAGFGFYYYHYYYFHSIIYKISPEGSVPSFCMHLEYQRVVSVYLHQPQSLVSSTYLNNQREFAPHFCSLASLKLSIGIQQKSLIFDSRSLCNSFLSFHPFYLLSTPWAPSCCLKWHFYFPCHLFSPDLMYKKICNTCLSQSALYHLMWWSPILSIFHYPFIHW